MSWVAWCKTLGLGHAGALSALFSAQYSIPRPPGQGPIVTLCRCVRCEEPPCGPYVESVPSLLPGRGARPCLLLLPLSSLAPSWCQSLGTHGHPPRLPCPGLPYGLSLLSRGTSFQDTCLLWGAPRFYMSCTFHINSRPFQAPGPAPLAPPTSSSCPQR